MTDTSIAGASDPRRFLTERLLPHTPAAVYAAFAEGERLARWWGPKGFRNEFERFEFRVGGRWHFTMIGPDERRWANLSEFLDLEPARRIVIRHDCAPFFTFTCTLEAVPLGTRLVWDQVFDDAATAQAVRAIVGDANEQNLDRLAAELARVT